MATAMEHLKLPEEGDFEFRCEVEVKPGFELPELDGIPIEKPLVTITDDDVSAEVDRARARRGHFAPVEGGPVEEDDIVIGDLVMTVNGEEIKREENYTLASRGRVLEGVTVENLGDILDGGKVGETKSFEGPLPDDHAREDLRGKTAKFTFTIADIKRFTLPPLDEEFLKAQGFDSEDELRNWFRQQMEPRLEQEIRRGMRNQVRKYLLDNVKLELPEGLSSRQTDRAVLRRVVDLRRRGVPMSEIEKHADELRTSAKEEVLTELKLYFILEQIAEKSEVEVSEEEINAQIAEIAREYGRRFDRVRDELVRENGIESLYLQIRDEKCIDSLLEKAKVTEARVEPALAARKGAAKKKKEEPAEEAPAAKKASAEGASKKAVAAEEAKPKKKAAKKKSDD
jgi:trigger factor